MLLKNDNTFLWIILLSLIFTTITTYRMNHEKESDPIQSEIAYGDMVILKDSKEKALVIDVGSYDHLVLKIDLGVDKNPRYKEITVYKNQVDKEVEK